jgi:hypothetical protein
MRRRPDGAKQLSVAGQDALTAIAVFATMNDKILQTTFDTVICGIRQTAG